MINEKKVLALIPARGGSKGLPGKNIRDLAGKPLLEWTIAAARESRFVDKVVLSTDSEDIAEVASKIGLEVPFLRPSHLATDKSCSFDALLHALDWFAEKEQIFDLVVWLQPTSPLRTADDIDRAIELYYAKEADAIVSVCEADHHPWWCNVLPEDGNMGTFMRPEVLNTNRQDLPIHYRLNGALYIGSPSFLCRNLSFYSKKTYAYVMPKERSVDIDSLLDFYIAEKLLALAKK